MNTKNIIGTVLGICLAINAQGSTLLTDDFNGTAINSSLWQVTTPFLDSSMTESGGDAIFQNRGVLASQANFTQPIDIRGRFKFTSNPDDNFVVTVRTDGTINPGHGAFNNGISIVLRQGNYGDPGNIVVTDYTDWNRFGYASFAFSLNTYYDFRIVDDGLNITGYINNLTTPLFSISTANDYGDKIGLFNRESYFGQPIDIVKLDYLTVSTVPEPSTLAVLALGCVAFGCFNKKRKLS